MIDMPIRILLANHQPIVRSGLRALLEREADFQIVAEAADGYEAITLAEYKRPAVTLLEIKLPKINGITVAKELLARGHPQKIVFVTAHTDVGYVMEAFKAGAYGYVAGDSASTDLATAIRAVACDQLFVSPMICDKLASGVIDPGALPLNLSQYLHTENWLARKP